MPFPDILKELREKKGFTQEQLAAVLHLSKNAISHYEKGINSPNIDTLAKIADTFDVSVDYLIGRTSVPITFSMLKSTFSKGTSIDDFLNRLLSLDNQHRTDMLKAMDYIKFHNDINAHQKKKTKP